LIDFVEKIRNLIPEVVGETHTDKVKSKDGTLRFVGISELLVEGGERNTRLICLIVGD
jgi:hypothetical protein